MLDFRQFDRISPDILIYAGEYLYTIVSSDKYITVTASDIDEDGNETIISDTVTPSLSTAIATIEALENGKEV